MIEKTGACLCCWFLEGESNRNHVITPIFLPCRSVVFPEYLVYLRNWCFLCYHRLPVLVTHHLKKKETFFPVLQMSVLIRKTDIWSVLFPYHSFMPFCLLHFVHPECGSRADPWWPRLQGHVLAQAPKPRSELLITCQGAELPWLQVYTVKSHFGDVLAQFN